MKKYRIVRDGGIISFDNDFFEVEADNREDALYDALAQLGYYCVEIKDIDATMREINDLLGEQ